MMDLYIIILYIPTPACLPSVSNQSHGRSQSFSTSQKKITLLQTGSVQDYLYQALHRSIGGYLRVCIGKITTFSLESILIDEIALEQVPPGFSRIFVQYFRRNARNMAPGFLFFPFRKMPNAAYVNISQLRFTQGSRQTKQLFFQ